MKKRIALKVIICIISLLMLIIVMTGCVAVDPLAEGTDPTTGEPVDSGDGPIAALLGSRSTSLQLVGLLSILSIAPAILLMMTGFTRIVIVLSFTRSALGLQQMPPNQVLVGLALFLTFFLMAPVFTTIKTDAIDPYVAQEITFEEAVDRMEDPLRDFMLRQTYQEDLAMFVELSGAEPYETLEEVPMTTLIPSFITSELKRGFMIGFFIYIPFIVIDMVVSSTLMAMGMMMLPPIVISLPFKVLLFVLVDGWTLTVESLITTFNTFT